MRRDYPIGPSRTEAEEQAAIFGYINTILLPRYPWLVTAAAVPNGGARPAKESVRGGRIRRVSVTGAKLKAQGVKAGFPDITIPVPMGRFHGFYMELKRLPFRGKNGKIQVGRIELEQHAWKKWLTALGYYHCFAYGRDEAISHIEAYIKLPMVPGVDYEAFCNHMFIEIGG